MNEEYGQSLEKALAAIPRGTFKLKQHKANHAHIPLLVEHFTTRTEGKGHIDSFLLFPGIELSLHRYLAEQVGFHHAAKDFILEINYCCKGRIGWNIGMGTQFTLASEIYVCTPWPAVPIQKWHFPWDITRESPLQ